MSKFEDSLWRDLVRDHGSDLAQLAGPAAKRPRRGRPRLLAGTTVGVAGAGTALVLALGAASSSPAFAVSRNHDGSVTVVIKRLDGIAGANRKLAQLGIRAAAVPVAQGCEVPPPKAWRFARQVVAVQAMSLHGVITSGLHARLVPAKIPAGRTLVLAIARSGRKLNWARTQALVRGSAPGCIGAPAAGPPLGAPGGGKAFCQVVGPAPGGDSGNSGNTGPAPNPPPAGKGGNSGNTGPALKPPPAGNSGDSGIGGNTGKGGGAPSTTMPAPLQGESCPPRTGATGNSGY